MTPTTNLSRPRLRPGRREPLLDTAGSPVGHGSLVAGPGSHRALRLQNARRAATFGAGTTARRCPPRVARSTAGAPRLTRQRSAASRHFGGRATVDHFAIATGCAMAAVSTAGTNNSPSRTIVGFGDHRGLHARIHPRVVQPHAHGPWRRHDASRGRSDAWKKSSSVAA